MSRRRREVQLLERLVLLALIIILIAMIARRSSDVARLSDQVAARAEMNQIQKAMSAYMLSSGMEQVEPAQRVSDFGASTPALWPDYLDRRCTARGRSYAWDEKGIVTLCQTGAAGSRPSAESGD